MLRRGGAFFPPGPGDFSEGAARQPFTGRTGNEQPGLFTGSVGKAGRSPSPGRASPDHPDEEARQGTSLGSSRSFQPGTYLPLSRAEGGGRNHYPARSGPGRENFTF